MAATAENVITFRKDNDAVPPILAKRLDALEGKITTAEEASLRPRWEFGQELVRLRAGAKKLPKGVVKYMEKKHGTRERELQYRAKFATKFPDEAGFRGATAEYPSWERMTKVGLVNHTKSKSKKRSAHARLVKYLKGYTRAQVERAMREAFGGK